MSGLIISNHCGIGAFCLVGNRCKVEVYRSRVGFNNIRGLKSANDVLAPQFEEVVGSVILKDLLKCLIEPSSPQSIFCTQVGILTVTASKPTELTRYVEIVFNKPYLAREKQTRACQQVPFALIRHLWNTLMRRAVCKSVPLSFHMRDS